MWLNICLLLISLVSFLYFYITRKWGSFKAQGVAEMPNSFPFGSEIARQMFTGKIHGISAASLAYDRFPDERFVGAFTFANGSVIVNDVELVRRVLVKDFDHFTGRRPFGINEEVEFNRYFSYMLTMIDGERWKSLRSTLSPVFSSGKLKAMTPQVDAIADELVRFLEPFADKGEDLDVKKTMVNFTTDSIARCGLGVEANSLKDPEGIFRTTVTKLTGGGSKSFLSIIKILLTIMVPSVAKVFKFELVDPEASRFMVGVIKSAIELRKKNKTGSAYNDYIDLMLKAMKKAEDKDKDEVDDDQYENDAKVQAKGLGELTEEELDTYMIANGFLLFFGGFETSSTTMAVVLHYLALNPDMQELLREEIIQSGGEIAYAKLAELKYLDMVIHEGIRMYPISGIERLCVKDYKVPGSNFVIPKGMMVIVPHESIMKDAKYFPNPDKFDPEHFSPENKARRSPYAYLGFGQGPRNCIGMRFALLQTKIALAKILLNYKAVPCEKTPKELIRDPVSQNGLPKGGFWLRVEKL